MPYPQRDENGGMIGLSSRPSPGGLPFIVDDDSEVVAFHTGREKEIALNEVNRLGQNKIQDVDSDLTKIDIRTALQPFKAQFQDAATPGDVNAIKAGALSAIEAL